MAALKMQLTPLALADIGTKILFAPQMQHPSIMLEVELTHQILSRLTLRMVRRKLAILLFHFINLKMMLHLQLTLIMSLLPRAGGLKLNAIIADTTTCQ